MSYLHSDMSKQFQITNTWWWYRSCIKDIASLEFLLPVYIIMWPTFVCSARYSAWRIHCSGEFLMSSPGIVVVLRRTALGNWLMSWFWKSSLRSYSLPRWINTLFWRDAKFPDVSNDDEHIKLWFIPISSLRYIIYLYFSGTVNLEQEHTYIYLYIYIFLMEPVACIFSLHCSQIEPLTLLYSWPQQFNECTEYRSYKQWNISFIITSVCWNPQIYNYSHEVFSMSHSIACLLVC